MDGLKERYLGEREEGVHGDRLAVLKKDRVDEREGTQVFGNGAIRFTLCQFT
jgi:hypothetical protein